MEIIIKTNQENFPYIYKRKKGKEIQKALITTIPFESTNDSMGFHSKKNKVDYQKVFNDIRNY